ncbi:hypothetical protein IW152_004756 [Coemansia sp. BCRC 34962]|nr:hypothetical protein IW152_004756 [Coemansia sp. BCRC 34962]
MRMSGTEPKLKYCLEVRNQDNDGCEAAAHDLEATANTVAGKLVQATENGFRSPIRAAFQNNPITPVLFRSISAGACARK